jgi:organic hydroperoxide reductase OsmC/OhrA
VARIEYWGISLIEEKSKLVEKGSDMEQIGSTPQPKIKHKSFMYQTTLSWIEKRQGNVASAGKPTLRVSSPPEFKGDPGMWTPEDLFVAAVETCTMTTFLAFAQRLSLPFVSYSSSAEGTLEFVEGGYQFTEITLRPVIEVASALAVEQVKQTLEDAHESCLISNSIKAEVILEPTITVVQSLKRSNDG